MRISDIFLAVPQVVLAIAIAQTLGPSLPNVILALSVTYWPWFARVVYAETRALQKEVFVESTAALGASPWRLTVLHVLPNIASPIIVRASIGMGFTILTAAALGFLGLGPPRPPRSGAGHRGSREFLPIMVLGGAGPGDFLTVMGFNLLASASRRARPAAAPEPRARWLSSSVRGLRVDFATDRGPAQVLDGINLDIAAGEVVGLVGESGCGKTTLAHAGILPELTPGSAADFHTTDPPPQDPATMNDRVRGRAITFIPEDHSARPPLFPVGTQIMDLMKWKSPRRARGRPAVGHLPPLPARGRAPTARRC